MEKKTKTSRRSKLLTSESEETVVTLSPDESKELQDLLEEEELQAKLEEVHGEPVLPKMFDEDGVLKVGESAPDFDISVKSEQPVAKKDPYAPPTLTDLKKGVSQTGAKYIRIRSGLPKRVLRRLPGGSKYS